MITILRLGHRPSRDKRITTHVGLVARAFNADRIMIDTKDEKLKMTLIGVVDRFGGEFEIETGVKWRPLLRKWPGEIVHLTMYGEHLDDVMDDVLKKITKNEELMIVVGSEKVPVDVYKLADFNIAIGHQPHSEVAALAIFLDRYFKGNELKKNFFGKLNIIGQPNSKMVIERGENLQPEHNQNKNGEDVESVSDC